jgi:hypothetical protein
MEVRDPVDAAEPALELGGVPLGALVDAEPAEETPHAGDGEAAERGANVPDERALEVGAVPPLQADLVVVDDGRAEGGIAGGRREPAGVILEEGALPHPRRRGGDRLRHGTRARRGRLRRSAPRRGLRRGFRRGAPAPAARSLRHRPSALSARGSLALGHLLPRSSRGYPLRPDRPAVAGTEEEDRG